MKEAYGSLWEEKGEWLVPFNKKFASIHISFILPTTYNLQNSIIVNTENELTFREVSHFPKNFRKITLSWCIETYLNWRRG